MRHPADFLRMHSEHPVCHVPERQCKGARGWWCRTKCVTAHLHVASKPTKHVDCLALYLQCLRVQCTRVFGLAQHHPMLHCGRCARKGWASRSEIHMTLGGPQPFLGLFLLDADAFSATLVRGPQQMWHVFGARTATKEPAHKVRGPHKALAPHLRLAMQPTYKAPPNHIKQSRTHSKTRALN